MSATIFITDGAGLVGEWSRALPGLTPVVLASPALLDGKPDGSLVLLDLACLKPADGVVDVDWDALCRRFRVIALASVPRDEDAMAWLQRGAMGYAHAYSSAQTLQQIVATVRAGSSWIGRDIMLRFCQRFSEQAMAADRGDWRGKVSAREAEVIEALRRGLSNKEIAKELDIAERTVKTHLTSLFQKFGVGDRLQLMLKLTASPEPV